jgi:hypothetical protein
MQKYVLTDVTYINPALTHFCRKDEAAHHPCWYRRVADIDGIRW